MERLDDILKADLDEIFDVFRDFTKEVVLFCGKQSKRVMASIQDYTATDLLKSGVSAGDPVYTNLCDLYYRAYSVDDAFEKALKQDAILLINGQEFSIIETSWDRGLRYVHLKRSGARGKK